MNPRASNVLHYSKDGTKTVCGRDVRQHRWTSDDADWKAGGTLCCRVCLNYKP